MDKKISQDPIRIEDGVFTLLRQYPFRGNIRELHNIVERVYVLHERDSISMQDMQEALYPTDLELETEKQGAWEMHPAADKQDLARENVEAEILPGEEERIRQALRLSGGSKGKAARLLEIDRSTLWRRMKKYGIEG